MTTVDERRRHLIWGREVLEEFANDPGLASRRRHEAARLLNGYPSFTRLRDGDDADLCRLQAESADVLAAAKALFQSARRGPSCSKQRRYSLLVVLRHFG